MGSSPNIIGGSLSNSVDDGIYGATIGGGGVVGDGNNVTGNHGTIGGGYSNIAGMNATVGGVIAIQHLLISPLFPGVVLIVQMENQYSTISGGKSNLILCKFFC
jgi:hypothetical protein